MSNYITIDGGTTNTRISLVLNYEIAVNISLGIGVKANINGKELYKQKIKDGIIEVLKSGKVEEEDIKIILCSGMITSKLGLYELEHLKAPCGIKELSDNIFITEIPEISKVPFGFVRGVKSDCGDYFTADMMRGEETELMGLGDSLFEDSLYILPGSHSKLIYTDTKQRISSFTTALTGEFIDAVANNTILKESIDFKNSELQEEYLLKGFECAKKLGINAALFKVRTLKNLFDATNTQTYSFFMGVALCDEIKEIISSTAKRVIIAGKPQLKIPTAILLKNYSDKQVICVDEEICKNAPAIGIIKIFEYK